MEISYNVLPPTLSFFPPPCLCFLWMLYNYHIPIQSPILPHSLALPWFTLLFHCTSLILTLISVFVSLSVCSPLVLCPSAHHASYCYIPPSPISYLSLTLSSLFPPLLTVNLSIFHCHPSLLSLLKLCSTLPSKSPCLDSLWDNLPLFFPDLYLYTSVFLTFFVFLFLVPPFSEGVV